MIRQRLQVFRKIERISQQERQSCQNDSNGRAIEPDPEFRYRHPRSSSRRSDKFRFNLGPLAFEVVLIRAGAFSVDDDPLSPAAARRTRSCKLCGHVV